EAVLPGVVTRCGLYPVDPGQWRGLPYQAVQEALDRQVCAAYPDLDMAAGGADVTVQAAGDGGPVDEGPEPDTLHDAVHVRPDTGGPSHGSSRSRAGRVGAEPWAPAGPGRRSRFA